MIFSKVLNEKPLCDIPYLVFFTLLVTNITGVFLIAKQLKRLFMSGCSFVSPDQLAISALNFSEYAKIQTFSHTPPTLLMQYLNGNAGRLCLGPGIVPLVKTSRAPSPNALLPNYLPTSSYWGLGVNAYGQRM